MNVFLRIYSPIAGRLEGTYSTQANQNTATRVMKSSEGIVKLLMLIYEFSHSMAHRIFSCVTW